MRKLRGIIVLVIAIVLGLTAAGLARWYLKTVSHKPLVHTVTQQDSGKPKPGITPVGFTSRIPTGMRAVNISVDQVAGVSRGLARGDLVDVIATTALPGQSSSRVSRIILQSVEVFDITDDAGDTPKVYRKNSGAWIVTLLMSVKQATTLSAARGAGQISLLLRNPEDKTAGGAQDVAFTQREGVLPYELSMPVESGLQELIPAGMRAFTIKAKSTDTIGNALKPGDRVDIMLTCPFSYFETSGDESAGAEGKVSKTHLASRILLQNVEILGIGERIKGMEVGTSSAGDSDSVTLLLSPEDAEKLTVAIDATEKSQTRLLLRNPKDHAQAETSGQLLIELLTQKREYMSIDVIRGNNVTRRKFYRSNSQNAGNKEE